jgi:hypothetical protein
MNNIIWSKKFPTGQFCQVRHHEGVLEVYIDGDRKGFTSIKNALKAAKTPSGQVVYMLCMTKYCATETEAMELRQILEDLPQQEPIAYQKRKINPEWKRYKDAMNEGGDGYNPHGKWI